MKLVCLWHGQEHEHERKFGAQNVMAKTKRNKKKKKKMHEENAKYKMENRKEIKHKQRHWRDASIDAPAPHTCLPSLPFTPLPPAFGNYKRKKRSLGTTFTRHFLVFLLLLVVVTVVVVPAVGGCP